MRLKNSNKTLRITLRQITELPNRPRQYQTRDQQQKPTVTAQNTPCRPVIQDVGQIEKTIDDSTAFVENKTLFDHDLGELVE